MSLCMYTAQGQYVCNRATGGSSPPPSSSSSAPPSSSVATEGLIEHFSASTYKCSTGLFQIRYYKTAAQSFFMTTIDFNNVKDKLAVGKRVRLMNFRTAKTDSSRDNAVYVKNIQNRNMYDTSLIIANIIPTNIAVSTETSVVQPENTWIEIKYNAVARYLNTEILPEDCFIDVCVVANM
jgi:hypothetical protein